MINKLNPDQDLFKYGDFQHTESAQRSLTDSPSQERTSRYTLVLARGRRNISPGIFYWIKFY